MVECIISIDLYVDETLEIKKNRLQPLIPLDSLKRICVVTGIHGDELEGQYVCYQLIRRINEAPQHLKGILDVYPALNPLGLDSISRGLPMNDMDMNRIFPGTNEGAIAEYVASKIVQDLENSVCCVDVHSSNIFLRELPQVRLSETAGTDLIEDACLLNMDLVWTNPIEQVQHATLAHSMTEREVPTFVIEMGVGMRITPAYGDRLVNGILSLMKKHGLWDGDTGSSLPSRVIAENDISPIYAHHSGIFLPSLPHGAYVKKADVIGEIITPLTGKCIELITAPKDGQIMTLREYPVVYTGSLVVRILGGVSQ